MAKKPAGNRIYVLLSGFALVILCIFLLKQCKNGECTVAYYGVFLALLAVGIVTFCYGCCRTINYEFAPREEVIIPMTVPDVYCERCAGKCTCTLGPERGLRLQLIDGHVDDKCDPRLPNASSMAEPTDVQTVLATTALGEHSSKPPDTYSSDIDL